MKNSSTLLFLIVFVCTISVSYVTHLIIVARSSRMTFIDKSMLRNWVDLLRENP